MQRKHRIFIAINLSEDVKKDLVSHIKKWDELPARWTDKENLHITLQFLGNLTDEEVGEVCMVVKEVAERHDYFSLSLNQILYSPTKPNQAPKMIWAQGEKSKELSQLRKDLEDSLLEKVRFVPEERAFAPHITLARLDTWAFKSMEPEERPEINEPIDLAFTVESIEVMESELKRGGPQYTVLESSQLKE